MLILLSEWCSAEYTIMLSVSWKHVLPSVSCRSIASSSLTLTLPMKSCRTISTSTSLLWSSTSTTGMSASITPPPPPPQHPHWVRPAVYEMQPFVSMHVESGVFYQVHTLLCCCSTQCPTVACKRGTDTHGQYHRQGIQLHVGIRLRQSYCLPLG